ncbi:MAG: hypothetical protein RSE62_03250 [Citrobacter sp.]
MRVSRSTPSVIPIISSPASSSALDVRRARLHAATEDRLRAIRESTDTVVSADLKDFSIEQVLDRLPKKRREKRKGEYVHVSDLIGKCARKIAICDRESIAVAPDRLSVSDELTFAQGDAIHDVIKAMATSSDARQVWGKWKCSCGHLFHDTPCTHNETDPNDICPQCDTPTNVYEEVSMYDDELMIVGNPDLLRWIRSVEAFHVTEIKSLSAELWKELVRPDPKHIVQVLFYWLIMQRLGYRMVDTISIIYATKGYIFKGKPYREFIIEPLKELHRLAPYLELAEKLLESRTSNTLPPRDGCTTDASPKARKCEACRICFEVA